MNAYSLQAYCSFSFNLDSLESARLKRKLECLPSPYEDVEEFQLATVPEFAEVNPGLHRMLGGFRSDPESPGAIVISNCPVDSVLPNTPSKGERVVGKSTFVSEACLLGIGRSVGESYRYSEEKDAELIQNVVPLKESVFQASNEGSARELDLHTEVASGRFRPHFIGLFCLRSDHEGKAVTCVADVRTACSLLESRYADLLRDPLYQMRVPESFAKGLGGLFWSEPRPILSGPREFPEICLNYNGMRALSADGQLALSSLHKALSAPGVLHEIRLTPGDLLIINNRKAVHGRLPFKARFDGKDRWLQRAYFRTDLWEGRGERKGSRRLFALRLDDDFKVGRNVIPVGD